MWVILASISSNMDHTTKCLYKRLFTTREGAENHEGKQNSQPTLHLDNCSTYSKRQRFLRTSHIKLNNMMRVFFFLTSLIQNIAIHVHSTPQLQVHGSWTEGEVEVYTWIWVWATAGKKRQRQYVLGLFRGIGGGGSLWSFCSPQCTRAKMFTYWRVPCYRDGGNGRAIGLAANRTTHLNTRGQRSSGTSIPSVKPDAKVY